MKINVLKSKLDYKTTFLFGLCLGFIGFLFLYGFQVLNVTNDGWLLNSAETEGLWDLSQHYQGWRAFRTLPWSFPLGLTEGLYSKKISVAYTDSIPLFAIFFKLLSPLLPKTFQYFGLFGFLCYGFMGAFGALIARKASSHPIFIALSSIFFIINPVLLKRMFYHTALSAHFLILAAICLWIYRENISNKWFYICSTFLGILSVGINPYFLPMVGGILCLCILCDLISTKKLTALLPLGLFLAAVLLSGWCIGLFYGDVSPSAEGLTRLSFNLNQFFNPANPLLEIKDYNYLWTTQNYSTFLPTLSLPTPWQEEGFSYLGLGFLLFLVVTLIISFQKVQLPKGKLCIAGFGAMVFLLLAESPVITFGSHTLLSLTLPKVVTTLLSVFRSTGRLIWPVYYGIISFILLLFGKVLEQSKKKNLLLILFSFCLAIQILDLSPALSYKSRAYQQKISYESPLTDEMWKTLGETSDELYFYTGSHLGIYCDPEFSCIFEEYAYRYNLSMNLSYLSRDISNKADARTEKHFKNRKAGNSYPNIIYVFYNFSELPDAHRYHLTYFQLNGYTIGVDNEHPILKNK